MISKEDQELFDSFWLQPNDRVELTRDPGVEGTVVNIDFDSYPFYEYNTTTCEVLWDDETEVDVQWDNKLTKVNV